jgi:hypothetical protein
LAQTSKESEDKEMEKLRNKAIDEIIDSERNYLKQLEIIEEYFMNPIKETYMLPGQVFAAIFGDILGIRQVNKELLTAMEHSTDQIGKVFLELAPYLKFYSTDANDFESDIKLIEEWKEKHKGIRTLVANAETRPEVQKKLNSLLITPIQRIPRYKLLLDDIIKNTPRFHPDRNNLEEARTQIDAIAWYINDQIKDHDHNQLMIKIQKSLVGGVPKIVKPGRKLIRHGNLMKMNKSGGHAQPRYFVLCTDMLMYCKIKGHSHLSGQSLDLPKAECLEVCCVLPLKHTSVENVVGKGVFTVTCQKETLVLYTTNADESSWVEDIQEACAKLKKNRATLKRESNQFEPIRKPDIIKMRRESLSKIMLMRRTEDAKKEQMREETRTKSPLASLLKFSPRKRKQDARTESPMKLKKILESPGITSATPTKDESSDDNEKNENLEDAANASTALTPMINELKLRQSSRSRETGSTPLRETPPRKAKENQTPTRTTPSRKSKRAPLAPRSINLQKPSPVAVKTSTTKNPDSKAKLKKGTKTEFRKHARNSVKSLSLHRAKQLKRRVQPQPRQYSDLRPSMKKTERSLGA